MKPIVLYSCTFARDLKRAQRLAQSVAARNADKLTFHMSAPRAEVGFFRAQMPAGTVEVFSQDDILAANPAMDLKRMHAMKANLRQQVIKSEFWRLGLAENYLVLDADSVSSATSAARISSPMGSFRIPSSLRAATCCGSPRASARAACAPNSSPTARP